MAGTEKHACPKPVTEMKIRGTLTTKSAFDNWMPIASFLS
jgi:hypothetical protein